MFPLRPDYLKFLLLSSKTTLRAQDDRTRDTTELIEFRQETGFVLFVQDMNSIARSTRK
jgi:hypothetical protein